MSGMSIESVEEKVDKLIIKVESMEEKLFLGNGDSLVTRIRILEERQQSIRADDTNISRKRFAVIMAILGLVFSIVGGIITAAVNHGVI